MVDSETAAVNIQRTWRGHHDRRVYQQLHQERNQKRQEHIDRANLLEAVLVIQTRARVFIARARRRILARDTAAATNIQKSWRGHHDREIAKKMKDERDQKMRDHIERANLLEAVLTLQCRMRVFLARIRRRKLLASKGLTASASTTVAAAAPASSSKPAATRGHSQQQQQQQQDPRTTTAATTIQRNWRGHADRKLYKEMHNVREQQRKEYVEKANLFEAVLLIQTRVRIWLAKIRRRIYDDTMKNHVSPVRAQTLGQVEDAATNIQRIWRGHSNRDLVQKRLEEKRQRFQQYVERANLLEAVLTIQTRVRILLAKARRRIYEQTRTEISPERTIGDAEDAVLEIQRSWRGHRDRKTYAQLDAERKQKMRDHVAKANLLEAVLTIQTRARVFLARCRFNILIRAQQRLRDQQLAEAANSGDQQQQQQQLPPPPPPASDNRDGAFKRSGVVSASTTGAASTARRPHPPNGNRAASEPIQTAGQQQPFRYSLTARRGISPTRHRHNAVDSHAPATAHPQMYSVPLVPRSGFFVRNLEEALAYQRVQSPYRGTAGGITDNNNNNNSSSTTARTLSPVRTATPGSPGNGRANAAEVLSSPESIASFVRKLVKTNNNNGGSNGSNAASVSKYAALGALIDQFGGDRATVIMEVWDAVTPFAECEALTAEQLGLIMMQLRSLRILAEPDARM